MKKKAQAFVNEIVRSLKSKDKEAKTMAHESGERMKSANLPSAYLIKLILPIDGWDGVVEKLNSGQYLPPFP